MQRFALKRQVFVLTKMQTHVMKADGKGVEEAVSLLLAGQVVGIPTETVYGLAANAMREDAVKKIFVAKGRPQDNPLIVHISSLNMLPMVAKDVPEAAYKLAEAFWPGPLTMILPRTDAIAPSVSAGLGTVGVRMPAHKAALAVISAANIPLAAPSANLSGSPSPTTATHVLQDMDGKIPLILDGGTSEVGVESTVLLLAGKPTILRPGGITGHQIEQVLLQTVYVDEAVTQPVAQDAKVKSPGMKYKHYAPKARLVLLEGPTDAFVAYVQAHLEPGVWALCFEEDMHGLTVPAVTYGRLGENASQANALFGALRKLDEEGARIIYAHGPSHTGVGLAVYNRLLRAAAFQVVRL